MTAARRALGVLESCTQVVNRARHVRIDVEEVETFARDLAALPLVRPVWRIEPHWWDGPSQSTQFVFVLDSLNFCFWSDEKWRITYGESTLDGYWALAASLRRAVIEGRPILDAEYLASLDVGRLSDLLGGAGTLLLMPERAASLRELGSLLCSEYGGQAINLVREAEGSAISLTLTVAEKLKSFADVAAYDGLPVRFLKRAQILCADLAGAVEGPREKLFSDLDQLTAFADYKLPQLLRHVGVLRYDDELGARINGLIEIPAGSLEEVEVRAATVVAVEYLRQRLTDLGQPHPAYVIDWWLWTHAQDQASMLPYHRTRSRFY